MGETVELKRMKYAVTGAIAKSALSAALSGDVVEYGDFFADQLVARITADLLGEDSARYEFRAPLNWWEAIKERVYRLPVFQHANLGKRWPVKYRHEVLTVKTVYPDLSISIPQERHVVRFDVRRKRDM